ncbi:hypothetical protein [Microbulbifer sp.]|uniref:hypothetical protein n=1 Tax=Microbulbifer sp. TaxID=1908541 RepID=UPI00258FD30B|nr:hypothetical protein [Microbulbifer sp.]
MGVALCLHGVALFVPVQFYSATPSGPDPLRIKLSFESHDRNMPGSLERPTPEAEEPAKQSRPATSNPVSPDPGATGPETPPVPLPKQAIPESKPTSRKQQPALRQEPAGVPEKKSQSLTEPPGNSASHSDGAKSRSTVFDPSLSQQLQKARNRVQKFETRDTNQATENGVFIQRGNKCWEFKKLLPAGNETNVTQRFNINCSERRRTQEDIDRLAEKYGIP